MSDEEKSNSPDQGKINKPVKGPGSKMQSISLKDYLDQKDKEANKKSFKLPSPVKMVLLAPVVLIACFGILFIPFTIYQIATGEEKKEEKTTGITYSDLMKKSSKRTK